MFSNMILKIKFYLKLFLRNPLIFISMLFNLFLLYKQSPSLHYNPLMFSQVFCFGFMASNLFLLIISTFLMNKKYEVFELYEKNKLLKQISLVISGMLISIITSLPTIIVIFIFLYSKYSFLYILSIILHFLILWNLSNFICLCIGTVIGNIFNTNLCFLFSCGIYSLFIFRLYSLSESLFYNLFNIFDDSTIIFSYKTNIIFYIPYIIDKLFIFILSILILAIGNLFLQKNKYYKVNILLIFMLLIFLITISYIYFLINI